MSDEQKNCKVIDSIFEALCRKLSTNDEVGVISEKFSRLEGNAERVSFASDLLTKYSLFPQLLYQKKNDETSLSYRQQGNEAFKKKESFTAWKLYTKSISYATNDSDCLALAYANRSAVFYEKQMYKQCLEDITNAFRNNYPKQLYQKLLQREEKARELLSCQEIPRYYEKVSPLRQINKKIECANTNVEIRYSETMGRHVVANTNIKLGDIIAIEKPYAQILLKDHLQDHCYNCLELCYNLIPCDNCVYAMYCSMKCQETAWNQYHKYECPILSTLYHLEVSKLTLLALRIAIMAKNNYCEIDTYTLTNPVYRLQSYEEIHFLATNTHLRKSSDLFPKATTAAILEHIMKEGSSFHKHLKNSEKCESIFRELIMRHLQTGPTNFHEICEIIETTEGYVTTAEIGAGAYAFLSLFNHSCAPNVVRYCHGNQIIVRAIQPIPEGTEILDNYGYHYAVTKKLERLRELRRQYYFDCACIACVNDWPLYRNLPQRGRNFDAPRFGSLFKGNRDEAVKTLARILNGSDTILEKFSYPNKFIADMQETIKQCYALLGNRKPKVF